MLSAGAAHTRPKARKSMSEIGHLCMRCSLARARSRAARRTELCGRSRSGRAVVARRRARCGGRKYGAVCMHESMRKARVDVFAPSPRNPIFMPRVSDDLIHRTYRSRRPHQRGRSFRPGILGTRHRRPETQLQEYTSALRTVPRQVVHTPCTVLRLAAGASRAEVASGRARREGGGPRRAKVAGRADCRARPSESSDYKGVSTCARSTASKRCEQ